MRIFIVMMAATVFLATAIPVSSQSNQMQRVESSRNLSPSGKAIADQVRTRNNTQLPSRTYGVQVKRAVRRIEMSSVTISRKELKFQNQIGIERRLKIDFRKSARVSTNPDGSTVNLLLIRSPKAAGIRVNFDEFDLPLGDEVWVYGAGENSQVFGPYTGKGPWTDSDFWSGIVEGDSAIIEYYSKSGKGKFKVASIAHIFEESDKNLKHSVIPKALSCHFDASCSNDFEKNSVGRIVFQNGGSFVCSGTLMNDTDNKTSIPYFLTANHCISTQTVAQTVTTYWFYQSTACNSGVLGGAGLQTPSGANLIATATDSDSTLLRLIDPAPMGAVFSGWDPNSVNSGLPVFGLHHPGLVVPPSPDSLLRRSAGQTNVSTTCSATGLTQGVQVDWTVGTTEPGSSGSGLWQTDAFGTYLVGTLSCGLGNPCGDRKSKYGRFSSFYPRIQQYLNPIPVPSCSAGLIDTSFGVNGVVTTKVGITSIDIQSDGRIVAAGYLGSDFALVRFKPDGSLDTSFGTGGIATTSITSGLDSASSVKIQADGKIVLAGRSQSPGSNTDFDISVVRYNSDGSLDHSFGTGGKVTTNIGIGNDEASSAAIQSDGKIVVAGWSQRTLSAGYSSFAILRYKPDGSLDSSFGTSGKVTTAIGIHDKANSVAIQPDGKIVAAGNSGDASGIAFAVVRYRTDGSLDTSFNFDGKATKLLSPNGGDIAYSVAIQSNGKIVVAGQAYPGYKEFGVVRYELNGSLDLSFGASGVVITDMQGDYPEGATSVAIQADGKIITAGNSFNITNWYEFAFARYNPNGSLDPSFGNGGKLILPIGGGNGVSSLAIQSDGRIVAAGGDRNGLSSLVRLYPNCF